MSLPPRSLSARVRVVQPVQLPRKRCDNDGKLFYVTKPTRRFCSNKCRMEYHRHGNSFGPLKDKLYKLIEKRVREATRASIAEINSAIDQLVTRVAAIEESLTRQPTVGQVMAAQQSLQFPPSREPHGR